MITLFGKQFKPLLAGKADLFQLSYPQAVTPKLDGIRCVIIDGCAYYRSLKPVRNKVIQKTLSSLPSGLDGELMSETGVFQDCTSVAMSESSELPWKYYIFDYLDPDCDFIKPYQERMQDLQRLQETGQLNEYCEILLPTYAYTLDSLIEIGKQYIEDGFEGTMVRDPRGTYKFGRSTMREGILLKIKEFCDDEATIIGFEELMHNGNEAKTNALGLTERSTHKDNKVGMGVLGALVVQLKDDPSVQFKIGTGFDAEQRADYWNRREELLGQLAKFKYFAQGIKGKTPRFPVFLGFRDPFDLD
jgi:DNA ligase-1